MRLSYHTHEIDAMCSFLGAGAFSSPRILVFCLKALCCRSELQLAILPPFPSSNPSWNQKHKFNIETCLIVDFTINSESSFGEKIEKLGIFYTFYLTFLLKCV